MTTQSQHADETIVNAANATANSSRSCSASDGLTVLYEDPQSIFLNYMEGAVRQSGVSFALSEPVVEMTSFDVTENYQLSVAISHETVVYNGQTSAGDHVFSEDEGSFECDIAALMTYVGSNPVIYQHCVRQIGGLNFGARIHAKRGISVYEHPAAVRHDRACTACYKKGRVSCDHCDQSGTVNCGSCGGHGSHNCGGCGGAGYNLILETHHDSQGRCYTESAPQNCTCNNGQVSCGGCGSSGEVVCDVCDGEGFLDCDTCEATGWMTDIVNLRMLAHYAIAHKSKKHSSLGIEWEYDDDNEAEYEYESGRNEELQDEIEGETECKDDAENNSDGIPWNETANAKLTNHFIKKMGYLALDDAHANMYSREVLGNHETLLVQLHYGFQAPITRYEATTIVDGQTNKTGSIEHFGYRQQLMDNAQLLDHLVAGDVEILCDSVRSIKTQFSPALAKNLVVPLSLVFESRIHREILAAMVQAPSVRAEHLVDTIHRSLSIAHVEKLTGAIKRSCRYLNIQRTAASLFAIGLMLIASFCWRIASTCSLFGKNVTCKEQFLNLQNDWLTTHAIGALAGLSVALGQVLIERRYARKVAPMATTLYLCVGQNVMLGSGWKRGLVQVVSGAVMSIYLLNFLVDLCFENLSS